MNRNSKENAKGQWFSIGGTDLYCKVVGIGVPVLLMHGYGQSNAVFEELGNYLAKDYQVILLDSRGHGSSGAGKSPISISLMAEDAVTLLDRLGINRANIIGHSDGGNVALQMAIDYPSRVKSIVVISGNASPDGLKRYFRFFTGLWRSALNLLSYIRLIPRPLYQMTDLLLCQPQISDFELRRVSADILFIRAVNDVITSAHTEEMARLAGNARIITIDHVNHASIVRNWRKYIRHIEKILEGRF